MNKSSKNKIISIVSPLFLSARICVPSPKMLNKTYIYSPSTSLTLNGLRNNGEKACTVRIFKNCAGFITNAISGQWILKRKILLCNFDFFTSGELIMNKLLPVKMKEHLKNNKCNFSGGY